MESQIVHIFQSSASQAIGFAISPWKGKDRIDIRIYVKEIDSDELIQTKKGISIPAELFDELEVAIKNLSQVMATEKNVAKLKKSGTEEVWIGVNKYKGHQMLYIRTYAFLRETNQWIPTQKGISTKTQFLPEIEAGVAALGKLLGRN